MKLDEVSRRSRATTAKKSAKKKKREALVSEVVA